MTTKKITKKITKDSYNSIVAKIARRIAFSEGHDYSPVMTDREILTSQQQPTFRYVKVAKEILQIINNQE